MTDKPSEHESPKESLRPRGSERKQERKLERKKANRAEARAAAAKVKPFEKPKARKRETASARGTSGRRVVGVAASALFGVVAVGALGAAAVGASVVDLPTPAAPRDATMQTIPAGQLSAVCPAAPQVLNSALDGTDAQFAPGSSSASALVSGTLMSELSGVYPETAVKSIDGATLLQQVAEAPKDTGDQAAAQGRSDSGFTNLSAKLFRGIEAEAASVVTAMPLGGQSALVSSLKTYSASDGDLQGIAAQNCTAPMNDQWLVGASTKVGVTSVLNLSNPTQTAATVNLSLFGGEGPIDAAGARGILVPAGQTKSIVLAGLAANQADLAVRVQSTGAAVGASIQTSTLRGLTPGGVDYIASSAAPSLKKVLTGIRLEDPKLLRDVKNKASDEQASNALLISAAGSSDATVEVTLDSTKGSVDFPGGRVTVPAGTVTEIPLEEVPAGNYSITLNSDGLIVAGVRTLSATEADKPVDLAYMSDSPQLGSQQLVTLPNGFDARLYFSSGDASGDIRMTPVDSNGKLGKEVTMTTAANTTLEVDPGKLGKDTAAVLVSASGAPSYGTLTLSAGDRAAIATVPILPVAGGTQQVPLSIAP